MLNAAISHCHFEEQLFSYINKSRNMRAHIPYFNIAPTLYNKGRGNITDDFFQRIRWR